MRPRHIYFEIKTESLEVESCDVRFYSVEKVPEPEDGTESFGTDTNPQDQSQIVTAAPSGPNDDYRKIEYRLSNSQTLRFSVWDTSIL